MARPVIPVPRPALFTSTSGASPAIASSNAPVSRTSATMGVQPVSPASASSLSARRAIAQTSNPAARRLRTTAAPMPEDAPVTRAEASAMAQATGVSSGSPAA